MRNLVMVALILLLSACGSGDKSSQSGSDKVMTVTSSSLASSLYFSGRIQPLKTIVITSPAEGVIDDMPFHYGDEVKGSQLLFQISSEKFTFC